MFKLCVSLAALLAVAVAGPSYTNQVYPQVYSAGHLPAAYHASAAYPIAQGYTAYSHALPAANVYSHGLPTASVYSQAFPAASAYSIPAYSGVSYGTPALSHGYSAYNGYSRYPAVSYNAAYPAYSGIWKKK